MMNFKKNKKRRLISIIIVVVVSLAMIIPSILGFMQGSGLGL